MVEANFPLFLKFPSSHFSLATAVLVQNLIGLDFTFYGILFVIFVIFVISCSSKSSSPFSSYSFSSLTSMTLLNSNSLLECNRADAGRQTRLLPLLLPSHRQLLLHLLECIHLFIISIFNLFLDFSKKSKINLKTKKRLEQNIFTRKFPQFVHDSA